MAGDTNETTVLVLRDAAGSIYVVPEDAIRACKATPEQQQALQQLAGTEDVVGYAAGGFAPAGSLVGPIQISTVVAPQTNVQIANQIAAGVGLKPTFSLGLSGANAFTGITGQRA